jgi:capsular polysaccharide biosynthesis protein
MQLQSPEILKRLVRRFGLLVLLTLVGAIAGGVYGAVKTPTYTAQAYVVVTGDPGDSPAALNFAQAYGRIVTGGPVAERAAAALGTTPRGLTGVTASTSPDAPVIEITATGADPARTAQVANAVAQALVDYGATRKDSTRVGLSVLALASAPAAPSSPRPPMELAVGAAGGLLVGGLAVLAGVGRSFGAVRRPRAGEFEELAPTLLTSYEHDAAPEYAPKAITSYRAEAAPVYPDPAPPVEKAVGRAVVIRKQDPR